jgi:lipid-A-disaccharide synthase
MRIALIAGELSGDLLGGAIIRALRRRCPDATFSGVAGPRMIEAGCQPVASIDALSVMGLAEVLKHLPRLLRLRSSLLKTLLAERPDCVIGIDAPDFNLKLEERLRAQGIRTVHVVSPTVWAWREGRVHQIARAVDHMLVLLPFEEAFYRQRGVPTTFIGHPLAEEIGAGVPAPEAREALGLSPHDPCVAMLPGSRVSEMQYLAEPYAKTARWLSERLGNLQFVVPLAKPGLRAVMEAAIAAHAPRCRWTLIEGASRDAMAAGDAVLVASGTATLECLLVERPMVVAYKLAPLTAVIMRSFGWPRTKFVALPNLLCQEAVVPEYLQERARAEYLGPALFGLLRDGNQRQAQVRRFGEVRRRLELGAAERAAEVIARVAGGH